MEFARDPRALGSPFFYAHVKLPGEMVHAQAIQQPGKTGQAKHTRQLKPPCLPERRLNLEGEYRFAAIPQAIAVGRGYAELVGTWAKVGIYGLTGNHRLAPGMVKAVKTIAETEPVGPDEAQRRVVNHQAAL